MLSTSAALVVGLGSGSLAVVLALVPTPLTNAPVWGQCGGQGYTGSTVCEAGSVCYKENQFFSNCYPTAKSTAKAHTVATSVGGKLYFGSATDNPELNDTAYTAILSDSTMFGQITPGNSLKWDATEPSRDAIVSLAKSNGQLVRGHNCVWYNQLPSWVTEGNFDAPTLTSILQTHISTVVGHYVEPFNDDGTLREFVFSETLGISYITTALEAARAADPTAKLYINDYNIEAAGAKSTAMIDLVTALKAVGTPIDGIGIQGHLIVGQVPSQADLIANFEAFTALGVEIAITELDIRMSQQSDYQTVISACKAVTGCIGVTLWDYTDKVRTARVPGVFSGYGAALPWDLNIIPKPAYDGIIAGFTS
ncbi:endo-1,4-beta-xylanase A precursor [Mycena capillaripes]|nr:endo-1,4-beta-xylanase A precursor [Mycena capillaripes]